MPSTANTTFDLLPLLNARTRNARVGDRTERRFGESGQADLLRLTVRRCRGRPRAASRARDRRRISVGARAEGGVNCPAGGGDDGGGDGGGDNASAASATRCDELQVGPSTLSAAQRLDVHLHDLRLQPRQLHAEQREGRQQRSMGQHGSEGNRHRSRGGQRRWTSRSRGTTSDRWTQGRSRCSVSPLRCRTDAEVGETTHSETTATATGGGDDFSQDRRNRWSGSHGRSATAPAT